MRQAEVQAQIARREIAATASNFVPLHKIASHDFHACSQRVGIFSYAHYLQSNPVVVVSTVIVQDGGLAVEVVDDHVDVAVIDRKSTRLNSSHGYISYAVFCLKKKKSTTLCSASL